MPKSESSVSMETVLRLQRERAKNAAQVFGRRLRFRGRQHHETGRENPMGPGPTDVYEARARLIEDEWFRSLAADEQAKEVLRRVACVLVIGLSLVPVWLFEFSHH